MVKFIVICTFVFGILISGCASLKETSKCVLGVSTKVLEDTRDGAIKRDFNQDYSSCYTTIKKALSITEAYIYKEEPAKNLIAIYISEQDTTPVGIFLTKIDEKNTQIEVSSPSTYAKELISKRIFDALEGKPILPPEKGENEESIF